MYKIKFIESGRVDQDRSLKGFYLTSDQRLLSHTDIKTNHKFVTQLTFTKEKFSEYFKQVRKDNTIYYCYSGPENLKIRDLFEVTIYDLKYLLAKKNNKVYK